ncbi:5324_t:CDS:1 [Paraglomus occultum]|uniref:5324_t:CDS:1 n=1 Tax=Paraglomus occultum TaxID=144539 RepID=A0A9N9A2C2_9GLOM|nr:5324_t:CDS:1 [Paraglomus occultum]
MSETIRSVRIRDTARRSNPKTHVVYEIEVRAAVRTWTLWKRYSEFEDLYKKFIRLFPNHTPPMDLPAKHFLQSTLGNPVLIEERKRGLEEFLQSILSDQDDRWRETDEWKEFLAIPTGKPLDALSMYTSESWLDGFNQAQAIAKEIRSLINRRQTHIGHSEVAASHNCSLQAKKSLTLLNSRVASLEAGLQGLAKGSGRDGLMMSEGELRRRTDMINDLKDEKDTLQKLVLASRPEIHNLSSADSVDRNALLRQPVRQRSSPQLGRTNGPAANSVNGAVKPTSRRVFGNASAMPQETEQTRGLDNQGLVKLQQQAMYNQDAHVEQFSAILNRQKHIGMAISQELDTQNKILQELDEQVDSTTGKLKHVSKKISSIK